MALINCPECNKEVSDKASACIHCGYPLEERAEKNDEYYRKILEELEQSDTKCPICGSTQIQAVPRKWSLATGFLTNKVDRVCLNCKHKF